jgi:autotransporter-associated beta strand protein
VFLNAADGNDNITLTGLQNPFTVVGGGQPGDNVTVAGVLTFTGNAVIGGVGSIVALPGSKIVSPTGTLSLSSSGSIGDLSNRLATQVAAENVTAGGNVDLAEDDGLSLQANAAGSLDVLNGSGTLAVSSAVTANGVTLSSGDGIVLAADLNAGSGTILINANTDGVGSDGLSQSAGAIITTDSDLAAVTINVNQPGGGTGNASIDNTSIGNLVANQGGGLVVNSNGGSILFAGSDTFTSSQQGTANGGGAAANTLQAGDYFFTATGAGSIGTDARPLQTTNFAGTAVNQSVFNLNAGDGGAYLTDWGPIGLSLQSASATGPGNIRVVSANAGGHNMFVTGAVSAGSGSIYLAADDNMTITAPIGGGAFSGTVYIAGNRDLGNTVNLLLNAGSSITTSNAGSNAVVLEGFNTNGTAAGGIVLNNITVGNGGTINVSTTPASVDVGGVTSGGFIDAFAPGVVLNAGPAGTVILSARPYTAGDAIDGGAAGAPLLVSAGTVDVTSFPTLGNNGGVFISSNIATAFNVSIVGSSTLTGNIGLATTSGTLTVAAPMQGVGGSTINLSGADGVIVAATLGGAATGSINITGPLSGTGGIVLGVGSLTVTQSTASTYAGAISGAGAFFKAGSGTLTVTGANSYAGATSLGGGTLVDDGSIVGTSNVATTGLSSIDGTGLLAPVGNIAANVNPGEPGGTGILNTGNLTFAPGGSLTVDLNSAAQAGTGYDQLNVTGSVTLGSVPLAINIGGSLAIGASFVLVNNDGSDPVAGTFASGSTVVGTDSTGTTIYTFAINYAGGDGNDVVATLVEKDTFPLVDVNAGLLTISDGNNTNNDLTTTITGGTYRIHDAVGPMSVTAAAAAAGWSVQGGDAVGPVTGITNIALHLGTGFDRIEGFAAGAASLAIDFAGNGLTIAGPISESGNLTLTGGGTVGALLDLESTLTASSGNIIITGVGGVTAGASSKLVGNSITVLVAGDGSIGTQGQPLFTNGTALNFGAGAGGIFVTQDVAASVSASAANGGNVVLANLVGALTIAGPITTTTGNITISSPDAVFVQANVNAGSGTIAIEANTDGNGTDGFTQSASLISTTNTQTNAVTITVNQPSGGTGNASLDNVFVGSSATVGGTLVVSSNGGSILDSDPTTFDPFQTGVSGDGGAATALLLQAQNYVFTATGSGSIGTDAHPLQTQNIGNANEFSSNFGLSAGDGGVYVTDWGTTAVSLDNPLGGNAVSATGPGGIRVVAANASGHNLFVAGPVTAVAGNIFIAADDKLTIAAPIGGPGFSGTVYLGANRDQGNAGQMDMSMGSITTTNASPNAVLLESYSSGTSDSSIILGSITVGDGGTIAVTTAPASGPAASTGFIDAQDQSVVLNAGPTGTILLTAKTFATEPAFDPAIGTFNGPLEVTAGTVKATVIATAAGNGNIAITSSVSTSFVANVIGTGTGTGTGTGSIDLSTQTGTLTISGPSTAAGGTINLGGFAGVALAGDVGSAAVQQISITGALSGAGNLIAGTGPVTLNQNAASTYSGVISGNQPVTLSANAPSDALTLTGASTYTGSTMVSSGAMLVTGSLAATSAITVQPGAALGGSGAVGPVGNSGIVSPGIAGSPGTLSVGDLTLGSGALVLDLSNTGADSVNATGTTVDISGSTLSLNVGAVAANESFTILSVPGVSGGLTGTFVNLPASGSTLTVGSLTFRINYTGGDGNDIVLTALNGNAINVVSTVQNGGTPYVNSTLATHQHSMVESIVYSFSQAVSLSASNFSISGFQGTPASLVPNVNVSGSGSVWTVTFSGNGVNAATGSIGDGEYQLVLGGVPGLTTNTYDFFRLLGDMDGNGTVNTSDFATLISTFLRATNDPLYLGADDFDGDQTIGTSDFAQFSANFLKSLPTPLPN